MTNITTASKEWMSRPDDQRFLSLTELYNTVCKRKEQCWTQAPLLKEMRLLPQNGDIVLDLPDPGYPRPPVELNHWSFSQLCQQATLPATHIRRFPAELACVCLQWGLEHFAQNEDCLILGQSNGRHVARSFTSTSYGRIWDKQVVEAVMAANPEGRWKVPAASYATSNPKRATTLYASDRDVFIFLVDPEHPVEVGGKNYFRGFYVWNSEVGSAVFGICVFLYSYVCDNRIIWGATNVKELRIRHTGGAPERFATEGARMLKTYAESSTHQVVEGIKLAQQKALPLKKDQTVAEWLKERGFTKAVADASVNAAMVEEGQANSVWDIVNGITAHARTIQHTDQRVKLETEAGKLMALVN